MTVVSLRADCAQCAALCCVALAFDRSPQFAIDKPAGSPCPHLNACGRCTIYAGRALTGFSGCVSYDCLGAGQRVTQMFEGRSWQDQPDLLPAMMKAFHAMRRAHDLLLLLEAAGRLPLSSAEQETRSALLATLDPAPGWTAAALATAPLDDLSIRVRGFLRSLRAHFDAERALKPDDPSPARSLA